MPDIPTLTDNQWTELLERLTHYALGKFRKCGWWRGDLRKLEWAGPDGASPDDVALEAITSVIEGKRSYSPGKHGDFQNFLRSVVDSLVSHMVEKAKQRRTGRMPVTQDTDTGEYVEVETCSKESDPADVCMSREAIEVAKEVVVAHAEEDPLAMQVLECMEADITKPAEMAEALGVDIKDINNAQKRLRRKLDQVFVGEGEKERKR